jgi:hypothetical protein
MNALQPISAGELILAPAMISVNRRIPRSTAIHEAGHAIAECRYGYGFHVVHVAARSSVFIDRREREVRAAGLCEGTTHFHEPALYGPQGIAHFTKIPMQYIGTPPKPAIVRAQYRLRAFRCMVVLNAGPAAEARQSKRSGLAVAFTGGYGGRQRGDVAQAKPGSR